MRVLGPRPGPRPPDPQLRRAGSADSGGQPSTDWCVIACDLNRDSAPSDSASESLAGSRDPGAASACREERPSRRSRASARIARAPSTPRSHSLTARALSVCTMRRCSIPDAAVHEGKRRAAQGTAPTSSGRSARCRAAPALHDDGAPEDGVRCPPMYWSGIGPPRAHPAQTAAELHGRGERVVDGHQRVAAPSDDLLDVDLEGRVGGRLDPDQLFVFECR